jgi:hypothetical protein
MIHRDVIWVHHWALIDNLSAIATLTEQALTGCQRQHSQLELRRNLPQDQSYLPLRCPQIVPSTPIRWVLQLGIVPHPSNTSGLGVAIVHHVVHMSLKSPGQYLSFLST